MADQSKEKRSEFQEMKRFAFRWKRGFSSTDNKLDFLPKLWGCVK